MHKLDNTPFAIVVTHAPAGEPEPVGMYRGRTHVEDERLRFVSLDEKLDLLLEDQWLRTIRSVPDDIADDLGHADYFITVSADELGV